MPRTDDARLPSVRDLALMEWSGQVATDVRQYMEPLPLAEDKQRHSSHHATLKLAIGELVHRR
ncbi:hypothetical protein ABIB26_003922 [Arthrobacter sp. UYEF20]